MSMLDTLFWWTGCLQWVAIVVLAIACGFPEGTALIGVTRLTFYGFGPVLWREVPQNAATLKRLKECGYHFLQVRPGLLLGLSLPTWLSRRLFARSEGST